MPRTRHALPLDLTLDRSDPAPLADQIVRQLQSLILDGRLRPATALPSTRVLAGDLGCARGTVVLALERLAAEGYVETRPGAGAFVARDLPDLAPERTDGPRGDVAASSRLSRRAASLLACLPRAPPADATPGDAFVVGRPALDAFPFALWARLLQAEWHRPSAGALWPPPAMGHPALRAAIAAYLSSSRGFACDPATVVVTSGVRESLGLLARLLADPGDAVWVEEPGYWGVRDTLSAVGLRPVPVPLDEQGLSVVHGVALEPRAPLAVVAPAHHWPLGVVMSLKRRLELLAWADTVGAWVVEDDYDGEYRYAGRPLAPLRALDGGRRVAYLGTFSKVLFPSLRLAWMVLPAALVDDAARLLHASGPGASALGQAALARFIDEGHFAAHLRRTRKLYAERQALLVASAARHLDGVLALGRDDAGMHLVAHPVGPADRFDDLAAAAAAARAAVAVQPLSRHYAGAPRPGLLLGYAAVTPPAIDPAIRRLARALAELPR